MDEVKVSVICLAYNHEKYIRRSLDSMLQQETNFKYEIIIHDDCSTDTTRQIIQEYHDEYPGQIKVILQDENQYQKGKPIVEEFMLPLASGKYIAFCECDDYWTDSHKLQLQYDYMESHSNCSLCCHNTIYHCLNKDVPDYNFNSWTDVHIMNEYEVFMQWKVHTSSFFMRKEDGYRDENTIKYWFGDYVRLTSLYLKGDIAVLPQVMSQYNYGVATGVLYNSDISKLETKKKNILQRKEYLVYLLNKYGKCEDMINRRIKITELETATLAEQSIIDTTNSKKEKQKAIRSIVRKKEFKEYLSVLRFFDVIKEYVKYGIKYIK